jgi:hypothetical protein
LLNKSWCLAPALGMTKFNITRRRLSYSWLCYLFQTCIFNKPASDSYLIFLHSLFLYTFGLFLPFCELVIGSYNIRCHKHQLTVLTWKSLEKGNELLCFPRGIHANYGITFITYFPFFLLSFISLTIAAIFKAIAWHAKLS